MLVYVEGPSDQTALVHAFETMYDSKSIHIEVLYGDLTSKRSVNPQNIVKKLGNKVSVFREKYSLKPEDIEKIICILDTDGTYCDERFIQERPGLHNFRHTEDCILANSKEAAADRNRRKAENMNRLAGQRKVTQNRKVIPFEAYFMSCNLDHVLQNKLNLSDAEKEKGAYEFADKCSQNRAYCESFFSDPSIAVVGSLDETWKFIRVDNRSLQRYTNLINCFDAGEDIDN